jgi:hypothetical protein
MNEIIIDIRKYSLNLSQLYDFSTEFYGEEVKGETLDIENKTYSFAEAKHAVAFKTILDSTFLIPEKKMKK